MGIRYNLKFNCPEKPSSGTGFIYALFDPRNPKLVKYIGKTITPLRRRLAGHNCTKRMANLELKAWIESLHLDGFFPSACVLETVPFEKLKEREESWIAFYKPLGLLNRSFGDGSKGLKGYVCSLNREITTARNKLGHSPEVREKLRRANLGKKLSEETKAKMWASEGYAITKKRFLEYNASVRRSIQCVETGEIIESINSAVAKLKHGHPFITRRINSGKSFDGKTWKFLQKEKI